MQTWEITEPYLNFHCELGEGPYHEPATNSLRFVDIKANRLHTIDLSEPSNAVKTLQFDVPVSFTANIEGVDPTEKIIVGGKKGVYVLNRKSGNLKVLKSFHDNLDSEKRASRLRCNDGAVDPQGRLWFGTQTDFPHEPPKAEGSLFSLDTKLSLLTKKDPLTLPNGLGWSLDNKIMYFIHTADKQILAFTMNAGGDIQSEQVFYEHKGDGEPDGMKVDVEGNLWVALHTEGKVIRISPKGEIIGEVKIPTKFVTCPVFVGTELWVTSANEDDSEFGGGLFRVDVGVRGREPFKFKLDGVTLDD